MSDKLVTDIGGDSAGPIPMEDHDYLFWEKQMIATFNLLQTKQIVGIVDLGKPGHVRTPTYVRKKAGVIERYCGAFENPEERAYGRWGLPPIPLYRVRFRQHDLWPDYDGTPGDVLELEIYDHWLAPADEVKP